MKIGIGFNSLLDYNSDLIDRLNRYHDEGLRPEFLIHLDFSKCCKNAKKQDVLGYLTEPGFYRHPDPYPYMVLCLQAIRAAGHSVVVILNSHGQVMSDQLAWLRRHLPDIYDAGAWCSSPHPHFLSLDLFVDENHNRLARFRENTGREGILLDRPYNRIAKNIRAMDWMEVQELIEDA